MKKLLVYLIYLILPLLIILLPSVNISGLSDVTQTGKFFVFSGVCIVLCILEAFAWIFKKEKHLIQISFPDILFLAFILLVIISRSIKPDSHAFSLRYSELFGLGVIYMIVKSTAHNPLFLFISIILAGSIEAIYGNLQLYGLLPSNHRVFNLTGSFLNPGPYAGYLISVLPVAIGLYSGDQRFSLQTGTPFFRLSLSQQRSLSYFCYKIAPILCIVAILSVIPATQSRAAWLAASVSSIFLLQPKFRFFKKIRLHVWQRIALGAIVFAGISILFFSIYSFKARSADGRFFIWRVTSNMIVDHPVFGCGFDEFKSNYMNYQKAYFIHSVNNEASLLADDVLYAFNEPLQFLAENGLTGSLLLLSACISLFMASSNKKIPSIRIAKGGIISILCFSLFSYPSSILPIKLNAVVFVGILASYCRPLIILNVKEIKSGIFNLLSICMLVIAIWLSLYSYRKLSTLYRGFKESNNGTICYYSADYDHAVDHYAIAYQSLHNDGPFLLQYGKALLFAGQQANAVFILTQAELYSNNSLVQAALGDGYKRMGQFKAAEQAYLNACAMTPDRFYPKYLLAKLYYDTHDTRKAIEIAKELLNKKVRVPSPAISEIRSEMEELLKQSNEMY